ncbi:hypothetical protein FHG87_000047 [Trinorchestia longiramus]|nr:hypothetical protein FHG87_000047 [Trinorchestia longiramus]
MAHLTDHLKSGTAAVERFSRRRKWIISLFVEDETYTGGMQCGAHLQRSFISSPLMKLLTVPVSTLSSSSSSDQTHISSPAQQQPQQQQRSIRSRFSRGSKDSKDSPRSGRRSEERDPGRGSPRSANRREREKDSREREKDGRDTRNTTKLTLDLHNSSSKEQCLAPLQEQQSKISKVASLTPSKSVQASSSNCSSSSSMVQSGIPQAATPGSPLAPGTGIPKPTAAVKGTAKSTSNAAQSHKEKNGRLPTSGVTPPKTRNTSSHANSEKVMQHQAFDSKDMKGSLTRQKQIGRGDSGVTVAMVSPMPARDSHSLLPNGNTSLGSSVSNANGNIPCYGNGNQVSASESASTLSEASQNSCHSTNSNSSGSSVIYRPTSSEDDLDVKIINKQRDVEVFEAEDGEDSVVLSSIKPMQPLMRPAQYMRGIASLHSHYKMGMQEPNNTVPQKGMRMSPHHPRRTQIGLQSPQSPMQQQSQQLHTSVHPQLVMVRQPPHMPANYSDLEAIDIANGYLSDGDVLRPVHGKGGDDVPMQCDLDGYLSEGGASLYAHKINQRFKEGIRQVQESMSKVQQYMHDDSSSSSSLQSNTSIDQSSIRGLDDKIQLAAEEQDAEVTTKHLESVNMKYNHEPALHTVNSADASSISSSTTKTSIANGMTDYMSQSDTLFSTSTFDRNRNIPSTMNLIRSVPGMLELKNDLSRTPENPSFSMSNPPTSLPPTLNIPGLPTSLSYLNSLSSLPSYSSVDMSSSAASSEHRIGMDDNIGGCDGDVSDFGDLESEPILSKKPASVSYINGKIFSNQIVSSHTHEDLEELEAVVGELEATIKQIYDEGQRNSQMDENQGSRDNESVNNNDDTEKDDHDYDSVNDSSENLEDVEHFPKCSSANVEKRKTVSFDLARYTDPNNAQAAKDSRRSLRFSKIVVPSFVSQLPGTSLKLKRQSDSSKPDSEKTISLLLKNGNSKTGKQKPEAKDLVVSKKNGSSPIKNPLKKTALSTVNDKSSEKARINQSSTTTQPECKLSKPSKINTSKKKGNVSTQLSFARNKTKVSPSEESSVTNCSEKKGCLLRKDCPGSLHAE